MKSLKLAALVLACHGYGPCAAMAAGEPLRRAAVQLQADCKTITNGTALEFFSVAYSTNTRPDQKEIWIQSLDMAYSTNSVRISSFAATADGQGFPIVGFARPFIFPADQNVKVFIRRTTGELPASVQVCAGSLR